MKKGAKMNRIEFLANLDKYKGEDHSTFLEHYGILGQKWGQRRWQNADGTFNEEGKIRYFGSKKAMEDQKVGGLFSKKDNGPDVDPIKLKNMGYLQGVDEPIIFTDKKGTYDFGDVKKNYETNLSRFVSKKDIPIAKKYRDDIEKMFDKFTGLTQEELDDGRKMLDSITDEHERKVVEKCLSVMCGSQYTLKPGEGMEIRFKGQPGSDKAAENTDTDLFTKKNEKGRSETADKMEDAAKKFREDGDEKLADETEKTAKEMRDATKITPDRKNMTKEEKKELRRATNNCWKTVNKGAWVSWFLFGLPGYAINCALNWGLVKDAAKREGIDGKSKTWSASDWNKITENIIRTYPRKYKKELAQLEQAENA